MRAGGVLQRMLRHYSPLIRSRGKVLRQFARKVDFVYFGSVDQHQDDHDVIRGLTVSTTHRDTHFAVGSYDGYDVSLVDRFDVAYDAQKKPIENNWVIIQLSLQDQTLPHVFFKPNGLSHSSYVKFFTANANHHLINEVFNDTHSSDFHSRYQLYGLATHVAGLEDTLSPFVTQTLAARFWPHAIEIFDNKLYVYITENRLSVAVLSATLQSATWLAGVLDKKED